MSEIRKGIKFWKCQTMILTLVCVVLDIFRMLNEGKCITTKHFHVLFLQNGLRPLNMRRPVKDLGTRPEVEHLIPFLTNQTS